MKGFKIKSNEIGFKKVKVKKLKVKTEKVKGLTYNKETEYLR